MTTPVPTVNVNLAPCDAVRRPGWSCPHTHCAAKPIPLPCPIPRSAVFFVALGPCLCPLDTRTNNIVGGVHGPDCAHARPIRVACSIGGDGTWAGSEVVEANVVELDSIGRILDAQDDGAKGLSARLVAACRSRWEIVKALVTNAFPSSVRGDLVDQRDAVYAALADMARAEDAAYESEVAWGIAMGHPAKDDVRHPDPGFDANVLPSRRRLSAYVARIIAQVGVLP